MSSEMIEIDGSSGEGGGQILRTSLALSAITGKPFRIHRIRGNRPKPGLRRQHMTAVKAAGEICGAEVVGAEVDSSEVTFVPRAVRAGDYEFDIGSAGSTMLVLQTILPPLMMAEGPSSVTLKGGTHNVGAPPLPFLNKTFLPIIGRMGPRVSLQLVRAGFAPRGGGEVRVEITPAPLKRIELIERLSISKTIARATIAGLPRHIAEREVALAGRLLSLGEKHLEIEELPHDQGPGNVVMVQTQGAALTTVFTAFGEKGTPAEDVAREAARQAKRYLQQDAPVDEHLADQLLLPMALAGGGAFVTGELSLHSTTNIDTIRRFIDVRIEVEEVDRRQALVRVGG